MDRGGHGAAGSGAMAGGLGYRRSVWLVGGMGDAGLVLGP
jgi:hypothetical protein